MKSKNSGLVYSTDGGRSCPECEQPLDNCLCANRPVTPSGDGVVRIQRESKGRGGKQVTIIKGLELPADDLKETARRLKMHCGSGGSVKGNEIVLQGDKRQAAKVLLEKEGHRVKLAGG